jgi:hypothetical protein
MIIVNPSKRILGYLFPAVSILFLSSFLMTSPVSEKHRNQVEPLEFIIEPPTLICLGFKWNIAGDENHNASVAVSYRKKGTEVWKQALPLLRLYREETIYNPPSFSYVAPNMFAGPMPQRRLPRLEHSACIWRSSIFHSEYRLQCTEGRIDQVLWPILGGDCV